MRGLSILIARWWPVRHRNYAGGLAKKQQVAAKFILASVLLCEFLNVNKVNLKTFVRVYKYTSILFYSTTGTKKRRAEALHAISLEKPISVL